MSYAPATETDIETMLAAVGVGSIDELFADIPAELRFTGELNIPLGIGEAELSAELTELASRNVDTGRELSFLGAGSYDHYVPAVCGAITSRSEFATAYTPYQPEVSQGTLQAIFEFQTAICELTGLPVANASLYDGSTAAAEAVYLAQQTTRRNRVLVLRTVDAQTRAVLHTYADAYGLTIEEIDFGREHGTVSTQTLRASLDAEVAAVVMQTPNAFGALEDAPSLCSEANEFGAVPIVSTDPLSLGLLEAPGVYGAGICVGDGQALGNAQAYGGPSFGFMAAAERFTRRMPGRIVGETVDMDGARAYTLTLQTREQHIRREKATSNICTNQALNALAGIVYMSWLGPRGLVDLGTLLVDRARALREQLSVLPGVRPLFDGPQFKELAVRVPIPAAELVDRCKARGVHPGWTLGVDHPELGEDALLIAVTEKRSVEDIQRLVRTIAEVTA